MTVWNRKKRCDQCDWDALGMWPFPRAQIMFHILHSPPAGITPIKVLKNPLFCQKCLVLGKSRIFCAAPLSLSLLGSLVFPLPGGCGACEKRGGRRHHVHPQLRGSGTAHRQEHRAEPAPAPVAELEQRWVSGGSGTWESSAAPSSHGFLGNTWGLKDAPMGRILHGKRFVFLHSRSSACSGTGPTKPQLGRKRLFEPSVLPSHPHLPAHTS